MRGQAVYQTADELWYELASASLEVGPGTKYNYSATLADISHNWVWNKTLGLNATHAAEELIWHLGGCDPEVRFQRRIEAFSHGEAWGGVENLYAAASILANDTDSRQCILSSHGLRDLIRLRIDNVSPAPLSSLHFVLDWDTLCLLSHVSLCSVSRLPYDLWIFTSLQKILAGVLGLERGWAMFTASILTIPEDHEEKYRGKLSKTYGQPAREDRVNKHSLANLSKASFSEVQSAIDVESLIRESSAANIALPMGSLLNECLALLLQDAGYPTPFWLDKRLV